MVHHGGGNTLCGMVDKAIRCVLNRGMQVANMVKVFVQQTSVVVIAIDSK